MNDVWFDRNPTDTREVLAEVPLGIALLLPDAKGFGTTHSLHQAMARDETGELKKLVGQFVNAETRAERQALMEPIIFAWTGQEGDYRKHYQSPVDARKIGALESFYGYEVDNPRGSGQQYARMYDGYFDNLVNTVFYQMAATSTSSGSI
jgi:hypothetical protein